MRICTLIPLIDPLLSLAGASISIKKESYSLQTIHRLAPEKGLEQGSCRAHKDPYVTCLMRCVTFLKGCLPPPPPSRPTNPSIGDIHPSIHAPCPYPPPPASQPCPLLPHTDCPPWAPQADPPLLSRLGPSPPQPPALKLCFAPVLVHTLRTPPSPSAPTPGRHAAIQQTPSQLPPSNQPPIITPLKQPPQP